jgi:hypothetical protein
MTMKGQEADVSHKMRNVKQGVVLADLVKIQNGDARFVEDDMIGRKVAVSRRGLELCHLSASFSDESDGLTELARRRSAPFGNASAPGLESDELTIKSIDSSAPIA